MIGQRFGRLIILEYLRKNGKKHVKCKCQCGTVKTFSLHNVRNGNTQSCGCLRRESIAKALTTHGMCNTSEYKTWTGILARCTNRNRKAYPHYGGRGITVCEEWHRSFEAFLNDMGMKPFESAQIDRIDNNKGYYPQNCRWTTPKRNSNNRRNNRLLTFNGMTKTMAEWVEYTGMPYSTIETRRRRGWSAERILTDIALKG